MSTVEVMTYQIGEVQLDLEGLDPQYRPICEEVMNIYRYDEIEFSDGDVVLDVGGHVGISAMYLAKKNPGIKVYTFEPVPELYDRLVLHLAINRLNNVEAFNVAVTADGRELEMQRGSHSAEATGHYPTSPRGRGDTFVTQSICIPDFLLDHDIDRVRLMKLDCEGAEHEILAGSEVWMPLVDYVRGEIHIHPWLAEQGYTVEGTTARVPADKLGSAAWQVVAADYYQ